MQIFNFVTIIFFLVFISFTIIVTYWSAKRTRNVSDFYAAGNKITGLQNGIALSGDFMSAASFLGIAGMVALNGYDGLIYSIGFLVGWPIVMFLVAEPLRNLGQYTFADVISYRLKQKPVRIAASVGALSTIVFYLIAQVVGAGVLIQLIFNIPYAVAVIIVSVIMLIYVLFGGMLATTWVQIIKAVLLLLGATIMAIAVLGRFSFNIFDMANTIVENYGLAVLSPGNYISDPINGISLGLGLMLGTAGLPHILIRFYTVPKAQEARKSVFYATGFIGYFYLLTFIIGFGAMLFVGKSSILEADSGGNMAAILLAYDIGGNSFAGFIGAVAFATILAVVAGLTISGASTISHDLYANVFAKKPLTDQEKLKISRISVICLGIVSIVLGLLFHGQNVAYMVGLAFSLAASANLPSLLLSILWKRFTTSGAVWSIWVGVISALLIISGSSVVYVDILHNPAPLTSLNNPTIISFPLALIVGVVVSLLTKDPESVRKYEESLKKRYLGSKEGFKTIDH